MKRLLLISLFGLGLAGCAELGEYNQKLANWAGEQIKIRDQYKQNFSKTLVSSKDIDTLYVRIKREFGFLTLNEIHRNCEMAGAICSFVEAAKRQNGWIHETNPGVYYRLAQSYYNDKNNQQPFYLDVTLEKEGKNVNILANMRGNKEFAEQMENRLLKTIK